MDLNNKIKNMMKNINLKMKERGFNVSSFAKEIGVRPKTLSSWLSLKTRPKHSNVVKIADLLNCSIESLIND